jgi:hypothetical protein
MIWISELRFGLGNCDLDLGVIAAICGVPCKSIANKHSAIQDFRFMIELANCDLD